MCFPYVGEGGAIMNTEKELHAFSRANIPFSSPYSRLDCLISLSDIVSSSNFFCFGVRIHLK